MAHWRDLDGNLYEHATLKEARKQCLVPSVSDVLSEIKKPQLEKWKMEQAVAKAMVTPFLIDDEETYDEAKTRHIKHVVNNCLSENAADFGTTVHNLIKRYCRGGELSEIKLSQYDENIAGATRNAIAWIDVNIKTIIASERTWISRQYGYSGQIDLVAKMRDDRIVLIDFKTQNSKNGKLYSYPDWKYQLGGYKIMYEENANIEVDTCINIVLGSNLDVMKVFEYTKDKMYLAKIVFLSALNVFRYSRDFLWEDQKSALDAISATLRRFN